MKSEKIIRAIGEIDDDIIEKAENIKSSTVKSKSVSRWGAVAAAVVFLTGAITLLGILKKNSPTTNNPSKTNGSSKTDTVTSRQDSIYINAIWADDSGEVSESEELTKWGRFNLVSSRLYSALEDGNSDDVFAILARPAIDYDFEYNGKKMERYFSDMCDEKNLPEKLMQLLKEGDALKYGTALYETGTPDGEKWYKSLYEERVNFYGAILSKYIVNGEFLKEQLKQDIEEAKNATEATDAYNEALSGYLNKIADSVDGVIPSETLPEQNAIIMYLTKEQFSSFPIESVDGWVFDLAAKNDRMYIFEYDE